MTIVEEKIEQFAHDHSTPESELFLRLRDETFASMKSPEMQVGRIEGGFLKMLVRLAGARRVLEIGMFTGYSALMMAEGLPDDGHLITCDIDPKAEAIASRYFAESPHGRKIEIRIGPALETIKSLTGPLDMVFIDADKGNYTNYYEACLPLLRSGGLIVADNVLWSGKVGQPADKADSETKAILEFNRLLYTSAEFMTSIIPLRDGVAVAWKQ